MIKLLIVEDSALMRRHLVQLFEKERGLRGAWRCATASRRCGRWTQFDPDVITLDINMPEMDGLTCLSRIMVQRPKPVVMVSSLTEEGAEATFEALQLGAVDFIHKPDGTDLAGHRSRSSVNWSRRCAPRRPRGFGGRAG